jgi:hypothetical protein
LPGLFAKQCNVKVVRVQLPCLPLLLAQPIVEELYGSMVKRISPLASNEKFQVRFLVELLETKTAGQPDWRREMQWCTESNEKTIFISTVVTEVSAGV